MKADVLFRFDDGIDDAGLFWVSKPDWKLVECGFTHLTLGSVYLL